MYRLATKCTTKKRTAHARNAQETP